MPTLPFTPSELQQIDHDRFYHPCPQIQKRMEVLRWPLMDSPKPRSLNSPAYPRPRFNAASLTSAGGSFRRRLATIIMGHPPRSPSQCAYCPEVGGNDREAAWVDSPCPSSYPVRGRSLIDPANGAPLLPPAPTGPRQIAQFAYQLDLRRRRDLLDIEHATAVEKHRLHRDLEPRPLHAGCMGR